MKELAHELDQLGIGYYWKNNTIAITEYVIGHPQSIVVTKPNQFKMTSNDGKTIYVDQKDFGDKPGDLTPEYIAQQCKRFHDTVTKINQLALDSPIEFSV